MNYLEILHQDILEVLIKEVQGVGNEERHNAIYIYVSEKINELRDDVWGEYRSDNKLIHQKDKKAIFDNFVDGFVSSEWKNYFTYRGKSEAELRKLIKNCLIESSATKNLLRGHSIALKSKDFYSVFLFYKGWICFTREKSKNRHHKNKRNKLLKELTLKFPKLLKNQIVGRESDIEDLHERLFDNEQVVLVNGMGGIGKTTVASVYATEYLNEYKHIVWVNQLTDDFMSDFINTRGLLISLKINSENKTSKQLFDEIVMKLKSIENSPCLMVIDNAKEELCKFKDDLPSYPNWHILATSREIIPHFNVKELGFFSKEEAIELFEKLYKRSGFDKADVMKIVEYVDYHTLTIEILALAAKKQGLSLDLLLTALEENIETGVIIKHSKDKIENITSYLCFIFENISDLDNDEKWLLIQFACLPSEFHSEEFLQELIQPDTEKRKIFKRLLSDLSEKGWILYNSSNDSYKMHRIIIDVVTKNIQIRVKNVLHLITFITEKLYFDESKDSPIDKFNWLPYGNSIADLFINTYDSEELTDLEHNLGTIFEKRGNYILARQLLEKAETSDSLCSRFSNIDSIMSSSNLAMLHRTLGNYKEAKKRQEKVISYLEVEHNQDSNTLADHYSRYSLILRDSGQYLKAKQSILKSIELYDENNTAYKVISKANLGLIYQDLGEHKKANELLREVKEYVEQNLDSEHPLVLRAYANLGLSYSFLKNYDEAEKLLNYAIEVNSKKIGVNHISTIEYYYYLSLVLRNRKEYTEAVKYIKKVVEFYAETFGNDHPKAILGNINLASIFHKQGDNKKAVLLCEDNFELAKKKLGKHHPTTKRIEKQITEFKE
jgi:tetratricopeptide (TPR) repeat protein